MVPCTQHDAESGVLLVVKSLFVLLCFVMFCPHLPTALAPVTESLLSLPIVSSSSSLEGAIKLSQVK